MRLPDSPDRGSSSDDTPGRAPGRNTAAGLAERLLRLPAGHPSGPDARLAPRDGEREEREPEEAVSHLPWPDDWVRHDGPAEPEGPAEAEDADADLDGPEPQADAGGQPESGEPDAGRPAAGHSAAGGTEPLASHGAYRPWFTVGDVPQPWFACEPDPPSSGPDG